MEDLGTLGVLWGSSGCLELKAWAGPARGDLTLAFTRAGTMGRPAQDGGGPGMFGGGGGVRV